MPEFDRRAFREALVNAFGHRDYAALGRVRVLVDDEGLTIANPGGFVEGVTPESLLTVEPHVRNECLKNALKRVGLAEKTRRGVDRIFEGSLVSVALHRRNHPGHRGVSCRGRARGSTRKLDREDVYAEREGLQRRRQER